MTFTAFNSIRRRLGLASMGILAIAIFSGLACREAPAKPAPVLPIHPVDPDLQHVVIISIDTLRADHLGCYGHPFVKSPTIDAVAKEGWRFARCISAVPTTLASHTTMLTGTYPHTHGTPRNGFIVNDDNVMLAEVMKQHGFTTAAFIGSYALASQFNFNQGFDHFDENFDVQRDKGAFVSAERYANHVTDATINWLQNKDSDHYFLFVHYFDVHASYAPPAPFDAMYKEQTGDFKTGQKSLKIKAVRQAVRNNPNPDGPLLPEVKALDGFYCGEISFTDSQINRLLNFLKERGILDRALLVITADHGETMTEHPLDNLFNHGRETYDTTVHVPLIIRFPGGKHGGRVIDRLVSSVDLMPSILDWFGMKHPPRSEGVSFAPLLNGDDMPDRGPVFAEATMPFAPAFEKDPVWYNARKTRCIVQDRWKLVHRPVHKQWELYDWAADPGERNNLLVAEDGKHEALLADLKARLQQWNAEADPLPSAKEDSEKTKTNLKSIGYNH